MPKSIPKLYGLVLAGGQSKRMGEDKSLIQYHNQPHAVYCFNLLAKYCEKVFLSLRAEQSLKLQQLPHVLDSMDSVGPITGILAAMDQHPEVAWLVLACDFPRINDKTIKALISVRDPNICATAFTMGPNRKPEPLCCIYEPSIKSTIKESIKMGDSSPQKILIKSQVSLIEPPNPEDLFNANEPAAKFCCLN